MYLTRVQLVEVCLSHESPLAPCVDVFITCEPSHTLFTNHVNIPGPDGIDVSKYLEVPCTGAAATGAQSEHTGVSYRCAFE